MSARRLAILGSTGSVGEQTLAVAADFPDRFRVVALGAGRNVEKLAEQVRRFRPERVSIASEAGERELRERLGDAADGLEIGIGSTGLEAVATHPADLVMAALVGAVGLGPTLAAVRAGRDVALANKEVLVMAGALVRREVAARGTTLLPVDSEHNAIFQALAGQRRQDVKRLLLTASGGPFRTWPAERIAGASKAEALNHPNWEMGAKITIDSASLMNKGLEVIEARWLFDMPPERVDVVVHPQSIVHSLVEFVDGSVLAQLGLPDMRVPIAVCLAHPERLPLDLPSLDLVECARLDFEAPDRERFPCLGLAYRALAGSEMAPAVLNAANEVAVQAFLDERIGFGGIPEVNRAVLDAHLTDRAGDKLEGLDDVLDADASARELARNLVQQQESA
ncbi:MAG: 1-deoxy-D-xylulose-5-phosphate reductoisomerase [Deltaproteobacteria bacterium]|nr:1-deoxy-D-xylulose-5-phosphate reductoisomerase [Deltaproteobacteria bacterium]MBW2445854.1 1-deoxy-D-xylulose-5-phosphate reductoisomerase [Deltaproteobacteria bacterium]